MESVKNIDKRVRAATIISTLVLIALVWYGIKTGKRAGFFLLSIFIISPAVAWLTAAISGPMVEEVKTV